MWCHVGRPRNFRCSRGERKQSLHCRLYPRSYNVQSLTVNLNFLGLSYSNSVFSGLEITRGWPKSVSGIDCIALSITGGGPCPKAYSSSDAGRDTMTIPAMIKIPAGNSRICGISPSMIALTALAPTAVSGLIIEAATGERRLAATEYIAVGSAVEKAPRGITNAVLQS